MMTLNDNPRVVAERRSRLLRGRIDRVNERYRFMSLHRDADGVVDKMYWTGVSRAANEKARRLVQAMWKQVRADEKFLKGFR